MNSFATTPSDTVSSVSWVSYILHFVVALAAVVPGFQVGVGLLVVAFVLDLFMKSDSRGTFQEAHYSWRLRSVVWAGVLYAVTAPLWLLLVLPGWFAWGVISLWFLYRIVRGMLALSDRRPV